jgi:hypothetical protein
MSMPGEADSTKAAHPATWGPAIDVPLYVAYPPSKYAERTSTPGALTSGFVSFVILDGPRLLKSAIVSPLSVAPTPKLSA